MDLMGIGEFARLSRLSSKALRLYDELELLAPARVDLDSGYRWCACGQLDQARLVASLRQIGAPLAQIKVVLGLDASEAVAQVAAWWTGAETQHADRREMASYLVDRLNGKRPLMHEIAVRAIPARNLLTLLLSVRGSSLWAVVDLGAMIDVENVNDAAALVDPVDDAIGAAAGTMTTCQRPEQRLADPLRVDRKCGLAQLEHRGGDALRKPVGKRSPCGRLEPDLVPLPRSCRHLPVALRRARSWRTVAMSAPGSPPSSAARLSEMRPTVSVSPRISKVISRPSRSSTESRTASGSPLRVNVIRSCCCRTRLASSDSRALASDRGTGVAAMLMVKSIDCTSLTSDQMAVSTDGSPTHCRPTGSLATSRTEGSTNGCSASVTGPCTTCW
jgi:DNA-binding transcriptional MerR regulator